MIAVKKFLLDKLGIEKGNAIYRLQQERLDKLICNIRNKSKSQTKTLTHTILPRVALYQVLKEDTQLCGSAESLLHKYMCDIVGAAMHKKYIRIEKVPLFYNLYSYIFLHYMKISDLWESQPTVHTRNQFGIDIQKCLWHDACVENGCPELCKFFCLCDDITYGGLHKIKFSRTQTLGMGGQKCDFHFCKK